MANERIEWIDFSRGLVIILMVWGHVMPLGLTGQILTVFHMPFFFVMAGYVLNAEKWSDNLRDFAKKTAKRLLLPYFLTELIWYPVWFVFSHRLGFMTRLWSLSEADPLKAFITIFLGAVNNNYDTALEAPLLIGPMWFFPCLFFAEIVFLILYKTFGSDFVKFSASLLITSALGFALGKYYPLPMSFDISLTVQVFIFAGVSMRKHKLAEREKLFVPACVISLLLVLISLKFNQPVDMSFRMYYNPVLFYTGGIAGTILIMKFSMICTKYSQARIISLIKYCGLQSVIVVAVHIPVVMIIYDFIAAFTPYKTQALLQSNFLVAFFTAGIAIAIPLLAAKYLGRKPIIKYFCQ